mgnify:CR=1 FL=1
MYCKDCKHRKAVKKMDELPSAICVNDKYIAESVGQKDTGDMMIYQYAEGGAFYVGDRFGCVHFKKQVNYD